jgi:hypothetical protein
MNITDFTSTEKPCHDVNNQGKQLAMVASNGDHDMAELYQESAPSS